MFDWIKQVSDLLAIKVFGLGGGSGGGGGSGAGGGGNASRFQGWAQKDIGGFSSTARSNRETRAEQMKAKTRDAWARDNDLNPDSLSPEKAKEFAKNYKKYERYYRPDLHSAELSQYQEALKDEYVQRKQDEAEQKGEDWTDASEKKAEEAFDEDPYNYGEDGDPGSGAASLKRDQGLENQINFIWSTLENHINDTDMHSYT